MNSQKHLVVAVAAVGEVAKYWWVRVCVCVCLSVYEDISRSTRAIFTKFFVHVVYGHGSILLRHHCDTSCTSGFVGDIMFL